MPDCCQCLPEGADRRAVLDRIPQRIDAARPAPVRLAQTVDEAVELALFLEGRIDQHQAALFLRRQMRAERQPAVEFDDAGLEIAGKQRLQLRGILGMQFDGRKPVLLAQQMPRDQRRARIFVRRRRSG